MIQGVLFSGSILTTCLVVIVTGIVVYWLTQKWKYNYPPGPPAWPLIGNSLQVDFKTLHKQAFEWSKKYGPVITVRLGPMPIVFVNKIEPAMEVLVKKSTDFASRRRTPSIDVLTYGGKDIAFSDYGPTCKLHRKIAANALRQYMQGDALEHRLWDAVETAFAEIDKVSGQFDPDQYISFIVADILISLCFGGKYAFNDEEIRKVLKAEDEVNDILAAGVLEDYVPGLKYIYKTQGFKHVEELSNILIENFTKKEIQGS